MKIVVVGAGAVGGYCAGRLIQAGHQVHILELGEHLAAIRSHGLHIQTRGGEDWVVHPPATDNSVDIGRADLVIVAVQSQHTSAIAAQLLPLVGQDTLVIPLQNNVDNPAKLAVAVGVHRVLPAAIFIAASRPQPGLVCQLSDQVHIYLGEYDGRVSDGVKSLAQVFVQAGVPAEASSDVWKEIWNKFVFVIGFYLTAPLLSSAGEILDHKEACTLHERLIHEAASVAEAKGVRIGKEDLAKVVQETRHYGDYIPSSVQEMKEGRADEFVHMLTSLIVMAGECGVPTPVAETTLAFTKFFNDRNKRRFAGGHND